MRAGEVSTVVVVVPAHDEAALLARCLTSLEAAVSSAAAAGIRCIVRVVLDDCTDESARIAAAHPFPTVRVVARRVGAARAAGVGEALAVARADGGAGEDRIWIANTDADSAVPANWLVAQCDLAAEGADLVIGTVQPDFSDLGAEHRRHWERTHLRGSPNGHVHGANLGIRASVYREAGGFAALAEHEDVDLVRRCVQFGADVRASDVAEVLTSGRFIGRTPGGYAGYLREQAAMLAAGRLTAEPVASA